MQKITLVIYDMDGLLIDSEKGMWQVNELRAQRELGYPEDINILKTVMGSSFKRYKELIMDYYGDDFPFDEFVGKVLKYNQIAMEEGNIDLMPGAIEILNYCKNNNIKCRLATSTHKQSAIKLLKKLNIFDYFEQIHTGDEVSRGKPYPDIFLKTLGDVDKENALIFEDSRNGGIAAYRAGIKLVLVPDVLTPNEDDKKRAYRIVNNLNEGIKIIEEINK